MVDSLGWLWVLGEVALKSSIVCLTIFLAFSFIRRPTAGAKHLAMLLGMASFIFVPVVSFTLPGWRVLPARVANIAAVSSTYDVLIKGLEPLTRDASTEAVTPKFSRVRPVETSMPQPIISGSSVQPNARAAKVPIHASSWSWARIGVWIWGIGVGVAFLPVCIGWGRLMWIDHHARSFTIGPWIRLDRQCQLALRINRPVSIRVTGQCAVPLVWGIWHATILLPKTCKQWSAQRRTAVLMHEMAHIKRWDCLTHLVTRIVCAAFWFHPGVWWILHRMTLERELACDDIVLAAGTPHSDYAEHLLAVGNTGEVSAHRSHLLGSAALAMVSDTRLEARIEAIVDPHRTNITMTRSWAAAMIVFVAVVTIPLSMLSASNPPPSEVPPTPVSSDSLVTKMESTSQPREYSFRSRAYDLRNDSTRIMPQTLGVELPGPNRAVVFAPPIRWWASHWAGPAQNTHMGGMDLQQAHPTFLVQEPNKKKVWVKYFDVPIDVKRYPIFVLTYRAQDMDENTRSYGIYLDDGSGPDYGGLSPIEQRDLILDGQVHVLSVDLQTLNPIGDIIGLALGVQADATARARFELIDLRFESRAQKAYAPPLKDQPIVVRVVDDQGKPMRGVTVTVDAERTNWSQSMTTDDAGLAVVTPWQTKTSRHMIRVTQPGSVPIEVRDMPDTKGEIVVALEPAVIYRGVIVDEQGRRLEGIAVKLDTLRSTADPGPEVWTRRDAIVITDALGQWQSPPLPRYSHLGFHTLQLSYIRDGHGHKLPIAVPIEALTEQAEPVHILLPDTHSQHDIDPNDPREPGYDPSKIFRKLS